MKQYEVTAPYIVFGINGGEKGKKEYSLRRGEVVELPETNVAVLAMLSRKQIREIPTPKQTKQTK